MWMDYSSTAKFAKELTSDELMQMFLRTISMQLKSEQQQERKKTLMK